MEEKLSQCPVSMHDEVRDEYSTKFKKVLGRS